ncbi:MAG: hypothetical protein DRP70_10455 [Spirochaetes bacterium]|nr:MAG: hypothetical protein DRP60_08890 [Spirochaetota bacterium]RKX86263.1 MAG: hypothetical protein DRP70_10455 [Spirochaetota bacterium]RKX94688.1 MAG: hypothetical protein DRZ90_11500 [Spirochaetota bacterium]
MVIDEDNSLNIRPRNIRERILDAAERLFRQYSYQGLRMQQLSDQLGLSRKTLYNHFPGGKRDIWRSCVEREMLEFAGRLSLIVEDCETDYVERGGRILDIGREAVDLFYGTEGLISSGEDKDYLFPEIKSGYVENLTRFLEEGVRIGLLRKNLPVRSLSEVYMALISAWGQPGSTLGEGEVKSFPEFVETVMFTGMLTEEGTRQSGRLQLRGQDRERMNNHGKGKKR